MKQETQRAGNHERPPNAAPRTTPPDLHLTPRALQTPSEYLDVIWRRRGLILGVFAAVIVLAGLITARTKPRYEATATLMAESNSQSNILADAPTPALFGLNNSRVADHVELLRSRSMAQEAAALLDSNLAAQLLPAPSAAGTAPRGRPSADDLAELVQNSVLVRPVRETDIIQLRASASSPALATALANAYLRAYQGYNLEQNRTDVTAIRQFIEDQLGVVRTRLDSSERGLEAFKQKSHVVDLDAETKGLITQQSDLAVTWHQAQTESQGIDAQLAHVRTRIAQDSRNVGGQLENISSPLVASLKANLDQLEVEKANLFIQGFSDSSNRIQNLARQIADTRQQLAAEADKLVDQKNFLDPVSGLKSLCESQLTLETDLAATRAREGVLATAMEGYDGALGRLPQAERELARLSRDVETDRRVYSLLSDRYEEARIQEVGRIPEIRTVDSAHGARKVKPNIPANVMLGLMLGVALALGAGLGVEYFDTSVHSPRDLERRGFTVLASIPALTDRKLRLAAGSAIGRVASHLVSSTDSGSSAAEAFRMLRTSLQFTGLDRPLHTIVITSPGPGEGKSTVATNLATVLAQSGHRTLLLDADLRRPVLHSVFHRRKKPGFTDMVLLGNPDRDAIFPTGIEDLFCLPCGTIPPGPADVLNSSATDALLNRLSADYEYVVIDSPPVLVAADTAILTAKADATILVVRAGKTSTEAIEHARQVLHQAGARVAGFVVNGIKHSGRYGRDSYYYYKYRYTREPQNQRRPSWLRNGPSTDPDPSPCPPTPDPGSSATGCPGPA